MENIGRRRAVSFPRTVMFELLPKTSNAFLGETSGRHSYILQKLLRQTSGIQHTTPKQNNSKLSVDKMRQ